MSQIFFLSIYIFPCGISISHIPSMFLKILNLSGKQLFVLLSSLDSERQGGKAVASFSTRRRDRASWGFGSGGKVWPLMRRHVAGCAA